jgi:biotin-dependent carboxylase-like uncharacterized protein
LCTVEDLGRPGYADLGVPRSGAADPASLRLGNRLVGNPEGYAGIEMTALGMKARLHRGRWIAVTGAVCPLWIDGRAADINRAVFVPQGATLTVGAATNGVRSYLTVAGGIDVDHVLGSRSTDLMSGLGPPPLRAGTTLPLGQPVSAPGHADFVPQVTLPPVVWIRMTLGPRDDMLTTEALETLRRSVFEASSSSNRIALRLQGPALATRGAGQMPSEGIVIGAMQVPSAGQPLIFLPDHPTTGGYPVVAVAHPDDLWIVGQASPGTKIRFTLSRRTGGRGFDL